VGDGERGWYPPDAEGLIEFCSASRAVSPYKNPHALTPMELKHVLMGLKDPFTEGSDLSKKMRSEE